MLKQFDCLLSSLMLEPELELYVELRTLQC